MLTFEAVGNTAADLQASAVTEDDLAGFGDVARVEMGLYLDEEQVGGFSVEFASNQQSVYLPLIAK